MESIENKVAKSGLITLDFTELMPRWAIEGLDISEQLVEGLMLREKDFRAWVSNNDWNKYSGASVHVYCSTDAIVPTWAYMLIANKLSGRADKIHFGTKQELRTQLWLDFVQNLNVKDYEDMRVIIKGCSDEEIHESVYLNLTTKLTPVVKSLMFGEPCSTVPIFKS